MHRHVEGSRSQNVEVMLLDFPVLIVQLLSCCLRYNRLCLVLFSVIFWFIRERNFFFLLLANWEIFTPSDQNHFFCLYLIFFHLIEPCFCWQFGDWSWLKLVNSLKWILIVSIAELSIL